MQNYENENHTCLILIGEPRTWATPGVIPNFDLFQNTPFLYPQLHGKIDVLFLLSGQSKAIFSQNLDNNKMYFSDINYNDVLLDAQSQYQTDIVNENINTWSEKFKNYVNSVTIEWMPVSHPQYFRGISIRKYMNIIYAYPFLQKKNYNCIFIGRPDLIFKMDHRSNQADISFPLYPHGYINQNFETIENKKPAILFTKNGFLDKNNEKMIIKRNTESYTTLHTMYSEFVCINDSFFRILVDLINFWGDVHSITYLNDDNDNNQHLTDIGEFFWPWVVSTLQILSGTDIMETTKYNKIIVGQMLVYANINRHEKHSTRGYYNDNV